VSFLVNDWVELRADAIKICVEMQRPIPWRADTIGPWLDSLSFLTWLGSVTTAALVYMFRNGGIGPGGTPDSIQGWALLLAVLFSEHVFFLLRLAVRIAVSKIDTPGRQKERRDRFLVRKRYFEESLTSLEKVPTMDQVTADPITRASLEEDARQSSLHSASTSERFWARQKTWRETSEVGRKMIEQAQAAESKKKQ
jgi:anoctamin-10